MALIDPPTFRALSADSHITEPPHTYSARIDPKYRDRAPRVVREDCGGDSFVIDGMPGSIPLGIIAAAGIDPDKMKAKGVPFEQLHRGGWEPNARLADQDKDGILAEVIYPSVGMMLCNHPDIDFKQACMWAYNGWLAEEFCAAAPDRLIGLGQTALRSSRKASRISASSRRWVSRARCCQASPAPSSTIMTSASTRSGARRSSSASY